MVAWKQASTKLKHLALFWVIKQNRAQFQYSQYITVNYKKGEKFYIENL